MHTSGCPGQSLHIAVPASHFRWAGGVDLVKHVLRSLYGLNSDTQPITISILIPDDTLKRPHNKACGFWVNLFSAIASLVAPVTHSKVLRRLTKRTYRDKEHYESAYQDVSFPVSFAYYHNSIAGLADCMLRIEADVLIPVLRPFLIKVPFNWVGYIFDFQHRHLRQNFSRMERLTRDALFAAQAHRAKVVIVNSQTVQEDARRFFPRHTCEFVSMPMCPVPDPRWFETPSPDYFATHSVPQRYFIICNQLFVHKSHITAIEAMQSIVAEDDTRDVHLLCTGDTKDWRQPGFFDQLKQAIAEKGLADRVCFVGHLQKSHQIQLLRNSIALIQPTLFEGGPGGGSVFDAIAVGKRSIVSDIPVNKEIDNELVTFFKARDAVDLAKKMRDTLHTAPRDSLPQELIEKGKENLLKVGQSLLLAIHSVVQPPDRASHAPFDKDSQFTEG